MATLSRKSSKSDLLEQRSSAAGVSASEATSMSGAESKGDPASNRDSLTGAVMKDVVFQMEHSTGDVDGATDGAAYSGGATEW